MPPDPGTAPAPGAAAVAPAPAAVAARPYSGFWRRVAAYLIDYLLFAIVAYGGAYALGLYGLGRAQPPWTSLLSLLLWVSYKAGMESSPLQATIGKMACGVIVTDTSGERISFGRAVGRCLASFLSGLILGVGYLMVAFTARRQGLHDMLAQTLVVYRGTRLNDPSAAIVAPPVPGWVIALVNLLFALVPLRFAAAIAISAYQAYTVRTEVAEGLTLAAPYKSAVAEAWDHTPGGFARINSPAQRPLPAPPTRYVQAIEVRGGAVVITYGRNAAQAIRGRRLALVPGIGAGGELVWLCGYGEPPAGVTHGADARDLTDVPRRYLPAACR